MRGRGAQEAGILWPGQETPGSSRERRQGPEILVRLEGLRSKAAGSLYLVSGKGAGGGRTPGSQPSSAASSLGNLGICLLLLASVSLPYSIQENTQDVLS